MIPETIANLTQAIGLAMLYMITGFGPGFALGILLGNITGGRGKDPLTRQHSRAMREAAEHNAQWSPAHERWKKPPGY